MIPKILHRCTPAVVIEPYSLWWKGWQELHPNWEFRTWVNGDDADLFPILSSRWAECSSGAQMADLVRMEAVFNEGGVFVDMDFEPKRPIDELLQHDLFFGTEDDKFLANAIFGARPGHPMILEVLQHLRTADLSRPPNISTGPHMLTKLLGARRQDHFQVVPSKLFFPYNYREKHRHAEDFSRFNCFAVHHWWKSW